MAICNQSTKGCLSDNEGGRQFIVVEMVSVIGKRIRPRSQKQIIGFPAIGGRYLSTHLLYFINRLMINQIWVVCAES